MRIPSARTRRDMEAAAELRAQGANWETCAINVGRHVNSVMRWTRVYREDWERLLHEAEQRLSQQAGNESRTTLRKLLAHKSSRVRLSAADKLTKLRLDEKASEPAPDPRSNLSAFFSHLEEISDEELEAELADVVGRMHEAVRQVNHGVTASAEAKDTGRAG